MARWKRERYEKLTAGLENLTESTATCDEIAVRLRNMVESDEQWEQRNPPLPEAFDDSWLVNVIVNGVMEDNRRLHSLTRKLFNQVSNLISAGASDIEIIGLLRRTLLEEEE
ncbi:MAG: hypothetical protein D6805_03780 [Planctomycetota bacterium]|nr:MAG: hypothetical protein D6805_03780 [Planctomycetota bacterium]